MIRLNKYKVGFLISLPVTFGNLFILLLLLQSFVKYDVLLMPQSLVVLMIMIIGVVSSSLGVIKGREGLMKELQEQK